MIPEEELNSNEDTLEKCQICDGSKITYNMMPCSFCNETGVSNKFASSFIKNHICLCSTTDRKNCPICKKKCHHDSALRPRLVVAP
jgi:hypothetical protein